MKTKIRFFSFEHHQRVINGPKADITWQFVAAVPAGFPMAV